ncbi:MAG: peroxiredoxin family protein, partial [Mycobacterium sp.]
PPAASARSARRMVAAARGDSGRRWWTLTGVAVVAAFAVCVLYLVFQTGQGDRNSAGPGSGYRHVAGAPGAGAAAPPFTLAASTGKPVALSDFRGRSVLLYFQEGLSCQPCWDQIGDLEQNQAALKAAGVDAVVLSPPTRRTWSPAR